ncbi:NAD(P)H-binding protein [Phytomonospora sp. NPDC050363]|uniref:SDR family oxidoreductase n=1 Tax=Phytomonospora sp. NPDC050363 TaxID=3155642 RepID=UPI0033F2F8C2
MITVTGATGNVGTILVRTLVEAGEQVNAVSRGVAEFPAGVVHHRADLGDPSSLAPAVEGADALFVLLPGEMGHMDPHKIFATAKAGGVRRVVLLSSQGVVSRPLHAALGVFEEALKESGPGWTVLRPGGFASNAFMWAGSIRAERVAAAPFADVALPVVDPADIAAMAAASLLDAKHDGRTYTITGPAPVSPREQVAAIAAAVGADIGFHELSRDEAFTAMSAFMPEGAVEATLAILGEPTEHERGVSPDVREVLGRPAGSFADWAVRNAAAFG